MQFARNKMHSTGWELIVSIMSMAPFSRFSSFFPLLLLPLYIDSHTPPKTACGCPCGGVIEKTKKERKKQTNKKHGHTHSPLTQWNAFVNAQLQILGDRQSIQLSIMLEQQLTPDRTQDRFKEC